MVAPALLARIRSEIGESVEYAEPPIELGGGFYTANHRFSLRDAPPGWDGPMVARLFPTHAPDGLAAWEAAVQTFVHERGLPAPRVVLGGNDSTIEGRQWFVMELVPGRMAMADLDVGAIIRKAPWMVRRLPALTADAHLALHRLDPAPLVEECGAGRAHVDRWFAVIDEMDPALGPANDWLQRNRPDLRADPALCHGDTWGGNLLLGDDELTGLIDWSVATVAEPALDVGFLTMALTIAPLPVARPLQRVGQRFARRMARVYRDHYRVASDVDLSSVPYYEAMRAVFELGSVLRYRTTVGSGAAFDGTRPSWDHVADQMADFIEARTGIRVPVPPPVH